VAVLDPVPGKLYTKFVPKKGYPPLWLEVQTPILENSAPVLSMMTLTGEGVGVVVAVQVKVAV
jgi:hypothetical protein